MTGTYCFGDIFQQCALGRTVATAENQMNLKFITVSKTGNWRKWPDGKFQLWQGKSIGKFAGFAKSA